MEKKIIMALLVMATVVGMGFAGSVSLSVGGAQLSYSWVSDASRATDKQIEDAVRQGLKEGFMDGSKDKNNSSTTHYGDSYSQYSHKNSFVLEHYHDAYMKGFKEGAGKPPSITDTIWW